MAVLKLPKIVFKKRQFHDFKVKKKNQNGRLVQAILCSFVTPKKCNFGTKKKAFEKCQFHIFSCMLHDSTPPFMRPYISFWFFYVFSIFWPYCSCPNALVTLNTAPAHLHATRLSVYPALSRQARDTRFSKKILANL